MPKKRDTYRYELKDGKEVVYRGITNDIEKRAQEHSTDKNFSHIKQVGPKVTRDTAEKWEANSLKKYRNNHSGNNPKYNKTDNG